MSRSVVHVARGREWRGGEFQVLLLVRTLAAGGTIAQQVVTSGGSRLAAELGRAGLPVTPTPWGGAWDPRALVALIRQLNALRAAGHQPLLHAHDSHALGLALLARSVTQTPVVATRRSITAPGALWRRADRVIAISRAVADTLTTAGVSAGLIAVVPSGVADEHLRPVDAAPPLRDPAQVVAIGAPTSEKGHTTLRAAVALITDPAVELTIADRADPALLDRAFLFVQPSIREALGTAVLVAMARGIPVIASRTGGLVELLEGETGLLVPPGNAPALAAAIRQLLGDEALRTTLVRNARRRVEEYTALRMAEGVTDVYASVLSRP